MKAFWLKSNIVKNVVLFSKRLFFLVQILFSIKMETMTDCIFCKIINGDLPSWKVFENETVYAFFDINPLSQYHTLVIPKNHYINIYDVPEKELKAVISAVQKIAKLYQEKIGIEDIRILSNNGSVAGQEVFHLHYHIIPHYRDDAKIPHWNTGQKWGKHFDEMLEKLF